MKKVSNPTWRQKNQRTLLDHSRFLKVEEHHLILPDGREIADWPIVITPDYANILTRTTEGQFLFFRQSKYAVGDDLLSPPGGYLNPGEDPLAGAQRELREETGYASTAWHSLGSYVVDANRGCGMAHLFLALDARKVAEPIVDDLEEQTLCHLTRDELEAAIDQNQSRVLAWVTLAALGLRRLDRDSE